MPKYLRMKSQPFNLYIMKISLKSSFLFLILFCCFFTTVKGQQKKITDYQNYPEEKLGWHLGTQAYSFRLFTFHDALLKTDSANLKFIESYPGQPIGGGIEGKMDYTMSPEKREEVLKLLKEQGITLYAYGVVKADSEESWRQLFEFAKAMGIKNINSEPNREDLPLVGQLANEFKIKVSIHNHPEPSIYWSPDSVLQAIQTANSKYVGACADIGHWIRSGLDPVESLKKLEGHVYHLHFKDLGAKDRKAKDVHWGTGVTNVPELLNELKRQKFKGMFSAEYETNWEHNTPDITASVQNFRDILRSSKR